MNETLKAISVSDFLNDNGGIKTAIRRQEPAKYKKLMADIKAQESWVGVPMYIMVNAHTNRLIQLETSYA